jgi:5-bromo-4-chloroindolyl phosphate hydrolysis protein
LTKSFITKQQFLKEIELGAKEAKAFLKDLEKTKETH